MRIIEKWQYRYIEKCLYDYNKIKYSPLETEQKIAQAIEQAYEFFRETSHKTMMQEFYFSADIYRNRLTSSGHYRHVCEDLLFTEEPNGYVIRREIIYRVAMNCYALNLFQIKQDNEKYSV